MRRNQKIAPLVLATAACLFSQAIRANDIEPTKEKYTASYTLTPITLDGKLNEWAGAGVIADPRFAIPKGSGSGANPNYVLFEEYAGGTWTGPEDQTSAVQVVYDADNVYFGFVVTDDYHENSANSAWNGDSVQLMIANGDRNSQVALYNYALGGIEGELGEVVIMHEAGPGGTEAVVTRDADAKKTYYEIKLPVASLGLTKLEPGVKFGLGMAINDGDELTPGQKGWGGLGAHALVFGKSPSETALVTLGANKPTFEVLGIGTEALLGSDLTDPENDGDEAAGPTSPTWNWVGIDGKDEPYFNGGEGGYNIFDNIVGGGDAKWCCTDPSEANPLYVSVQFAQPVSITHFTITSGNDTPDRRPTKWQIQGSNDGTTFTPIFVQNDPVAIWTEHDQVVKVTLPIPSVPFRHIRYFVTETPGSLHQLGEIEYFGTFGGTALAYYSGINPAVTTFAFRITDAGTSVVDPTSIKLNIDGQNVTIPTPTKVNGAIDVLYTPAEQFLPGTSHTYKITSKDGVGNSIVAESAWTTPQYALLQPADKVTADTAKRGFVFKVHQNSSFQDTTISRALNQLAGVLGQNYADPAAQGVAIAAGVPGANANAPITFEIDTVINVSQNGADSAGNFTTDDVLPGIPGIKPDDGGPTDGVVGDVITYLQLPAGKTTLIVNSDDGFRTTAGQVNDVFKAQFAGNFEGGRGAADSTFTVYTKEAGVYPFRTVWYEGGGGANLEWLSLGSDGITKVLLNDEASGGIRAYRAVTVKGPPAITAVVPSVGATGVAFDTGLQAVIQDGQAAVDTASVKLSFDGTVLNVVATKSGDLTTIQFQPPNFLASGSVHTASIAFTAGGVSRTETWSFTVGNYGTLTRSHQAVSVDKTKPGFLWNVFQNQSYTHTSLAQTEQALAGTLTDTAGVVLVNNADPAAVGVATANGVKVGPLFRFEIPTVINMSQNGADNAGNWTTDDVMPGVPGLVTDAGDPTDGVDAEVITFVDLPAGIITLGVNSDDGFRTQGGYINTPADGVLLGQFDGGRGATDTLFKFVVTEAGTYPIRTIYQEGGGGANIEIFSVKADGTKALINDSANGGYKSYRTGVAPAKPTELPRFSSIKLNSNGSITITWTGGGTLQAAPAVNGPYADVPAAVSPYTFTPTAAQLFGRLRQ